MANHPDSDTFFRLELFIPNKIKNNPDAELAAMIYLASIGEQLDPEKGQDGYE